MIKKAVISVLAVGLVTGVLFGRDAFSYLKTSCSRVSQSVKDSVPTDFQIDRARTMVADLTPVIRESMHVIAKEEVALEQLDKRIAGSERKNQKLQSEIMQLQSDLTTGKSVFRYANRTFDRNDVERDLASRFARFKVDDETLSSFAQMRDARAANLDAAREKYTAMVSAQKKLQTDLMNLDAKRQLVEVAQASSDFVFDDTQLARTKQLITDIRTSLDVKAKLANADIQVTTEIPLDASESGDITEQVASYFGLGDESSEIAAVSYDGD
jgi:hypothetical protein